MDYFKLATAVLQNAPYFSGLPEELDAFLCMCQEAYNLVTEIQQKGILILIKSKLSGEANNRVRAQTINDFQTLKTFLKTEYSKKKGSPGRDFFNTNHNHNNNNEFKNHSSTNVISSQSYNQNVANSQINYHIRTPKQYQNSHLNSMAPGGQTDPRIAAKLQAISTRTE